MRGYSGTVKKYLGDAVYAEIVGGLPGGNVVLTTEDGIEATNRIVLEPDVLAAFAAFVDTNTPEDGA